jgi:hypothetical protein
MPLRLRHAAIFAAAAASVFYQIADATADAVYFNSISPPITAAAAYGRAPFCASDAERAI